MRTRLTRYQLYNSGYYNGVGRVSRRLSVSYKGLCSHVEHVLLAVTCLFSRVDVDRKGALTHLQHAVVRSHIPAYAHKCTVVNHRQHSQNRSVVSPRASSVLELGVYLMCLYSP